MNYFSIEKEGKSRYEEKKSVFWGFSIPVTTEEDAIQYIQSVKKQFPDARHHVYAYVLRDQNKSRYSDDGEPSGTAGMPVLDCIRKSNLTDCLVVVVRYFGGTLLGTGGLVHAYTVAASDALNQSGIVEYRAMRPLTVVCTYPDYQKLQTTLAKAWIDDVVFDADVTVKLHVPAETGEDLSLEITNITSGRAIIALEEIFLGK